MSEDQSMSPPDPPGEMSPMMAHGETSMGDPPAAGHVDVQMNETRNYVIHCFSPRA